MSTTIPKPSLKLASEAAEGIAPTRVGETAVHAVPELRELEKEHLRIQTQMSCLKEGISKTDYVDLVARAELGEPRLKVYDVHQSVTAYREISVYATSEEEAVERSKDQYSEYFLSDCHWDEAFIPEICSLRIEHSELLREWNEDDMDPTEETHMGFPRKS
tara:strand:- start:2321 stop:2803 length:483 start_codon:yes stop_codon:yes gene_type:complete